MTKSRKFVASRPITARTYALPLRNCQPRLKLFCFGCVSLEGKYKSINYTLYRTIQDMIEDQVN
jgi:hypothetical protein